MLGMFLSRLRSSMASLFNQNLPSPLDRFRQRRWKWWVTVPTVVALGFGVWIGLTGLTAYFNITSGGEPTTKPTPDGDLAQSGQINLLLIGVGGAGHPGGTLADSIILASFDQKAKVISLLSIPRDLYVTIPGNGQDKINAVHAFGESNASKKGGGPALLKEVVSEILGVPVHHFIRLDFDGFRKIVDTIGGITLTVKTPINDPFFPDVQMRGYEPFRISAGPHKMNGALALKYARSRETTSDFDRARRQQEVLVAIKDKILSAQVLANPLKVTNIVSILGRHLLTDTKSSEIDRLVTVAKSVQNPNIRHHVLGNGDDGLIVGGRAGNGASIQIPQAGAGEFGQIQTFARAFLAAPQITLEGASVTLASAGASTELVATVSKELTWAGFRVTESEAVNSLEAKTTLYDLTKSKSFSRSYLKAFYKPAIKSSQDGLATTDFLLAVGPELAKAAGRRLTLPQSPSPRPLSPTPTPRLSPSPSPSPYPLKVRLVPN